MHVLKHFPPPLPLFPSSRHLLIKAAFLCSHTDRLPPQGPRIAVLLSFCLPAVVLSQLQMRNSEYLLYQTQICPRGPGVMKLPLGAPRLQKASENKDCPLPVCPGEKFPEWTGRGLFPMGDLCKDCLLEKHFSAIRSVPRFPSCSWSLLHFCVAGDGGLWYTSIPITLMRRCPHFFYPGMLLIQLLRHIRG